MASRAKHTLAACAWRAHAMVAGSTRHVTGSGHVSVRALSTASKSTAHGSSTLPSSAGLHIGVGAATQPAPNKIGDAATSAARKAEQKSHASSGGGAASSGMSSSADPVLTQTEAFSTSMHKPQRERSEPDTSRKHAPVTELVRRDHALVRWLYREYCDAIDMEVKRKKVYALIYEMGRHSAQEELVLYPFIRDSGKIPGGPEIVKRALEEHRQVKVDLKQADRLASDISNPEFPPIMTRAAMEFITHGEEEERDVLPLLSKHCSVSELMHLAQTFEDAAGIVASRPHPLAPDSNASAATLAHMSAKPMDAMRDAVQGRTSAIAEQEAEAMRAMGDSVRPARPQTNDDAHANTQAR